MECKNYIFMSNKFPGDAGNYSLTTSFLELFLNLLLSDFKTLCSLIGLSVFTVECFTRMVTYIPLDLTLAEVILVVFMKSNSRLTPFIIYQKVLN